MDYLPIFLKINGQRCLVVGGGEVAARKAGLLLEAGAQVDVIAPDLGTTLSRLQEQQKIGFIQEAFYPDAVRGYRLIVSATDRPDVNAQVAESAQKHNIPVNVVDCPALCSFIFPAIIDRSPVVAAVSSGGRSPMLSRLLRARLESLIPFAYGSLARFADRFRNRVREEIPDPAGRRLFWEKTLEGKIAEMVFSGQEQEAMREMEKRLLAEKNEPAAVGEVSLVGAGPGDPDLLTFRALRLIQQADVVIYDRLVSPEILKLVRRDAEKIYAGKERDRHTMPQEAINDLLARLALSGKRVVRLKGGDPFIFGRGGEEIETLLEKGVRFQVVPGITAASGCAAYAGIPLTHRDHAQSCVFITGHRKESLAELNWQQLVQPHQTVVIYMGLVELEKICRGMIDHGSPPDTPAALVQQGTTRNQRVVTGTLSTLAERVSSADIKPPTLIIIGSVVTLRNKLAWYRTGS